MNRCEKGILYLTSLESPDTGIIENQVYRLISKVARKGGNLRICLLSLLPISSYTSPHRAVGYFIESEKKRIAKLRELKESGVRLVFFPLLVDGKNFYMRFHELVFFTIQASLVLLYYIYKYRIGLIHARSYPSALVALCIRKMMGIEYIFDPRGIYPEEGLVHKKFSPRSISYRIWKRVELCLLREAASVVACSTSLANHLKSICEKAKVNVIPNCADIGSFEHNKKRRLFMRQQHNLNSKFVFVFSGGVGTWTSTEEMARLFLCIQKVKKDAILLILTADRKCTPNSFIPFGLDYSSIKVFHLEPKEVPGYLVMGDVGLMVRKESLVNWVAFPTKFAEYLACGLPVLSDLNVMDIADLIKKHRCGIAMETIDVEEIRHKLPILLCNYREFQRNGYELANSYLNMNRCAERYYELYKETHV